MSRTKAADDLTPKTKFHKWVKDYGIAKLAVDMTSLGQDYQITASAVYQHLHGATEPRPAKMRGYVSLAKGKITTQDLMDHIVEARADRSKRFAVGV